MVVCKCGVRMRINETRTLHNNTYRRYKCPSCGELIFTHEMESEDARRLLYLAGEHKILKRKGLI